MLKIFLMLWGVVYIFSIVSVISKLFQIRTCLRVLTDFLNSCSFSPYGSLKDNGNFNKTLDNLLFHYPLICKFSSVYDSRLAYGENPNRTYESAKDLYNSLCMKSNFLLDDLFASFNPINTLRKIASFPSLLLNFFGFQPNIYTSRFFNLIGWLIAYFLGMYQDEIKALISSFLKHS